MTNDFILCTKMKRRQTSLFEHSFRGVPPKKQKTASQCIDLSNARPYHGGRNKSSVHLIDKTTNKPMMFYDTMTVNYQFFMYQDRIRHSRLINEYTGIIPDLANIIIEYIPVAPFQNMPNTIWLRNATTTRDDQKFNEQLSDFTKHYYQPVVYKPYQGVLIKVERDKSQNITHFVTYDNKKHSLELFDHPLNIVWCVVFRLCYSRICAYRCVYSIC